ncbi:MAG: DNA (cytosine-5-)-methyltransferase [Tissierellia bacterium]|nr:DNA (cytosine-5-)-methyltransferase [Tissierellia bacterium]
MNYNSVEEKASQWKVSKRRVQMLCKGGRIKGAIKQSGVWLIPEDSNNPCDNKSSRIMNELRKERRVLSLFSGCGGMDLGFEGDFTIFPKSFNSRINDDWNVEQRNGKIYLPRTGFYTVFANDIRPDAQAAWTSFFSDRGTHNNVYYLDSIVDIVKLHKNNNIDIFPENIDVVTGGFPCQDFSIAGKRLGFDSETSHKGTILDLEEPTKENRGQLYIWMREVIEITKPKVFFAENVKGLTNLGDVKKIIESDFASVSDGGYYVFPARVLLTANYGVPQKRERVIFIGLQKKALRESVLDKLILNNDVSPELDPYPTETHSDSGQVGLMPYCTSRDVLKDLLEPELSLDKDQQSYSKAKYMGKHCQGQTEIDLDGLAPTIRSEHHGNIEFRRLSLENGGKNVDELKKGMAERRLTIRECARIQTFPDEFKFIQKAVGDYKNVTASDAYRLIGNAVPPLFAYHLAKRISELWEVYFTD